MKYAPHRNILHLTLLILIGVTICGGIAAAQQPAGAGTNSAKQLPDSPEPKDKGVMGATGTFIGYMSNRSLIFPDIAYSAAPLSTGQKFKLFVNQSISPPYLLAAGISAGVSQARDVPAAYGQGWDAYGSRYGATLARASSTSFFGTFVFASALHQDPRFYPQAHPTLWGSVKYSAQRIFVTRTDSGKNTFNASGLLGPLAAEALANVYLPQSEQTGAKNAQRYGTDLAWRFGANMFKNYWPTIFHDMGLNRLKVIPDPKNTQL